MLCDQTIFNVQFLLGLVLTKLATEDHLYVSCRVDTICTLHVDSDRSCINLYNYNDNIFIKTNSFPSPSNEYYGPDSVLLGGNVIYVSAVNKHCIYTLSMDGTLLGKHGRRGNGGDGELLFPRAAATDEVDNLLVCTYNHRLQVITRDGKWHIVNTDKKIDHGMP